MSDERAHLHPRLGTREYEAHVREEIEHYGRIYRQPAALDSLVQPVPAAWAEIENRASALIRRSTGNDLVGHVTTRLGVRGDMRMLSLGSGPGGVEIEIARRAPQAELVCLDISPELLQLGRQRAHELALNVRFEQADLNCATLPADAFDLVFCHAALHHVIELEALAEQIRRTLRPGGVFVTVDVVTRNGYLMWPETRLVVEAIWRTLPARFRLNHTGYAAPAIDDCIWEADTSLGGMECARSEDILPVLERRFTAECFVPYFSLSRRFFDTMYGANYDLSEPLDNAVFNWIWELDLYYLATKRLRPETFFGIYRPV